MRFIFTSAAISFLAAASCCPQQKPAESAYIGRLQTVTDSLAPGTCLTAVDTLGEALTPTANSLTLTAPTTSAWGSTGHIQIDSEILAYSGVTSGRTTIAVARAQNGTPAASHSLAATINMAGGDSNGVGCISDARRWDSISTGARQSEMNVMSFGAKGDCVTNDTPSFAAAQAAAVTYYTGNNLPAVLYLPKPPGGCYIVSDLMWQGISLEGQSSGLGPASPQTYNVTLKSMPGQDILHIPDPKTTKGIIRIFPGWYIRNISFIVDNSRLGSSPHRWPGRWFDDGAITSGSPVFTTNYGEITCGDVGQAIQVNGAGSASTNLVTTIRSVSPCWQSPTTGSWTTVTLATSASTTVKNAHTYISVAGLSVTTTIGNCAIAADMQDGKPANWVGTLKSGNYGQLEDVVFTASNPSSGNSDCGIYTQGNPVLYGLDVRNFEFIGLSYGVVQGTTELNSFYQSSSGDFEKWDHGLFFFNRIPWISYNGLSQRLTHIQLTGSYGFQILQEKNTAFDSTAGWVFDLSSFECPRSCSKYGHHITGQGHTLTTAFTSGLPSMVGYMDTIDTLCPDCDVRYTQINGYGNRIFANGVTTGLTDGGMNNQVTYDYNGNPPSGMPYNYRIAANFIKGSGGPVGRFTSDAIRDGNPSTRYSNDDLIITPHDLVFASARGYGNVVVEDSTSPTGYYMVLSSSGAWQQFSQFVPQGTNGYIVIGTSIPATGATIYFSAKCPSGTSTFKMKAGANLGSLRYGGGRCSTSYQTYSLTVTFTSSDVGKNFEFGSNDNTFDVAWLVIVPNRTNYNGYTPQPADGSIVLNPMNWGWSAGTEVNDNGSPFGFSQSLTNGAHVSSVKGRTNTNGGAMFPAVPSRVTYWVGAPTIFSTTLSESTTSTAASVTLSSPTTGVWPSSGNMKIDDEILGFSGVSPGQRTVTVHRGEYRTIPQAHSGGATIELVGTGQLGIKCNGTLVSVTDVYYAPTYTTFSSDFPAQRCSGHATQVGYVEAAYGGIGQEYNVAQIQIAPQASDLNVPSAANRVPLSASSSAFGNFWAYSSSLPVAGSGSGITTGPTSGTIANHVATFTGTNGQIADSGLTIVTRASTGLIGGAALRAGQCASGTASVVGAAKTGVAYASPATYPGDGFSISAFISGSNTVTVKVCAIVAGTPTSSMYQVTYQP